MQSNHTDVAVIGAGNIGIAVAWYLKQQQPALHVTLIDREQPMSLTSAVSGENYRNWWPHPVMKRFMDRSIDLLSQLDSQYNNEIITSRSGYVLASRDADARDLLDNLHQTFKQPNSIRTHNSADSYRQSLLTDRNGAEVLQNASVIQQCFPGYDAQLQTIVHIRRGGSISAYALGSHMLREFREAGGRLRTARVQHIDYRKGSYELDIRASSAQDKTINAASIVNAAGPFAQELSSCLGIELPIKNVYQQKIAFADTLHAVDRKQPFTIDLDPQLIDWTDDERQAIQQDPILARFTDTMPGAIHCRPDGGETGNRIKLGWAYNEAATDPAEQTHLRNHLQEHLQEQLQEHFPEIVLRGAARLNPRLKRYYQGFPRDFTHYGGYYTMTEENWPLIGNTTLPGYTIAIAMSGFGSMAACAAGELAALYITGGTLPDYADALSLQRSNNTGLMQEINELNSKGIL